MLVDALDTVQERLRRVLPYLARRRQRRYRKLRRSVQVVLHVLEQGLESRLGHQHRAFALMIDDHRRWTAQRQRHRQPRIGAQLQSRLDFGRQLIGQHQHPAAMERQTVLFPRQPPGLPGFIQGLQEATRALALGIAHTPIRMQRQGRLRKSEQDVVARLRRTVYHALQQTRVALGKAAAAASRSRWPPSVRR